MHSFLFSASESERAVRCDAATVLPKVDSTSGAAEGGRALHAFLQRVTEVGRDAALEEIPEEERGTFALIDTSLLPTDPQRFAAEVAFAFDTAAGTARELGRGVDRDYSGVTPSEIPGTADVVALVGDDAVYVADYKRHGHNVADAPHNLQLRTLAVMAARAYGRDRAIVEIIRRPEGDFPWRSRAELDAIDLDSWALDLGALASTIEANRRAYAEGVMPRATLGSHCRYCSRRPYCPGTVGLIRAASDPETYKGETVALLTPETAATAYRRWRDLAMLLEEVEAALKAYARETPIPLEGGKVYGIRPAEEKEILGDVAMPVLRSLLGDAASVAGSVEVTQAGVERAIRQYLETHPDENRRGALKALKEKALGDIKARGGLRVTQGGKLIEHTPKTTAEAA